MFLSTHLLGKEELATPFEQDEGHCVYAKVSTAKRVESVCILGQARTHSLGFWLVCM